MHPERMLQRMKNSISIWAFGLAVYGVYRAVTWLIFE